MSNIGQPNQAPKPALSQAANEMLGRIASATRRSDVRGLNPDLFHMVREGMISPDEMGMIQEAARDKQADLTYTPPTPPEEVPVSESIPTEEPWSPSGVLDNMPAERELDWRERQLPTGDR
jgi:hypothetical protein